MKIINSEFVESAFKYSDLTHSDVPEIAFIGRSNVGKSSLINALLQRKNLAQMSKKPGKTRTINIFEIVYRCDGKDFSLNFADLPGYGYAKISETMQKAWRRLIDDYILKRKNLCGLVLIVDIRHDADKKDIEAKNWIMAHNKELLLVPTKADKMNKSQVNIRERILKDQFLLFPHQRITSFSSKNKIGKENILEWIKQAADLLNNGDETC